MILGLITPTSAACTSNAGAHLITAGIRWLVRRGDLGVRFVQIDMLGDDPDQWAAAEACDALMLCGNPRFSTSEDAWWEYWIWLRLERLAETRGMPIVDAWGGACLPLPPLVDEFGASVVPLPDRPERVLQRLLDEVPRMARVAPAMRRALAYGGAIARDATALACYDAIGVKAQLLPCSSWWAADELGVPIQPWSTDTRQNAIVLLALDGHDWAGEALRGLAQRLHALDDGRIPTVILATQVQDWVWAQSVGLPNVRLITDPASLLREYSHCNRVVSLRVHASIPAASLGAQVCTLAVDTRAEILAPFDLPWQRFDTTLQDPSVPLQFRFALQPDAAPVVAHLRALLTQPLESDS